MNMLIIFDIGGPQTQASQAPNVSVFFFLIYHIEYSIFIEIYFELICHMQGHMQYFIILTYFYHRDKGTYRDIGIY